MIQIFPYSLTSLWVTFFIRLYVFTLKNSNKPKISLHYTPCSHSFTTTYFIIKSRFLTKENMHFYIEDIRNRSALAPIIIIGSHIDYDELFRHHYRIFGVIDRTEDTSLKFLREQIYFYLASIYPPDH